jgi:DDE superfamily endonuclease
VAERFGSGGAKVGAVARLRRALSGLPLPAWPDGRIRLGVDVSPWLRPDAVTGPGRLFCHVYGRGNGQAQHTSASRLTGGTSGIAGAIRRPLESCYRSGAGLPQGPGGEFGSVGQLQFGQDVSYVSLDGPL